MKKWRKTAAGMLLALALAITPVGTAQASTENPGILPGGEGLKGAGVSHVFYGEHENAPIETRVLSTNEDGGLLLLSEYLLNEVVFYEMGTSGLPNKWEGSGAQKWCQALYDNGFTSREKVAIMATSKEEIEPDMINGTTYKPCSISGEYLYFLSVKEARNSTYGFSDDTSRIAYLKGSTTDGLGTPWWLRSASTNPNVVGTINNFGDFGNIIPNSVREDWGGRPAFRVNLTSVLFASAAIDGKVSGTVGANALQDISPNATDNWKLTIKDKNRTFKVTNNNPKTVKAGQTLQLNYENATVGSNEYVSAMMLDGNDKPVYYGRMKQVDTGAEDGVVDIAIPTGLPEGEYTLQVFSEQVNGDQETDYASELVNVPVKVVDRQNFTPAVTDSKIENVPPKVKKGEKFTFTVIGAGMDNGTPVRGDGRWLPLSFSVNPSGIWTQPPYTAEIDTSQIAGSGEQQLTVTYAKQEYDGGTWADTGETQQQSVSFLLEADPEQPTPPPATPGDVAANQGGNPGTDDPLSVGWLAVMAVSAVGVGAVAKKKRSRYK